MVLSCKDIKKSFGANEILTNVSFLAEDKEKLAIVGVNGAGKTTLFKILTSELSYDSGEISIAKDKTVGYLSQNMDIESDNTTYTELLSVFNDLLDMEYSIREMENLMASLKGDELEQKMQIYSELIHEFEIKDGYKIKSLIRGIIKGIGFTEEESQKKINTLSGGQKTRVCLGKLLLQNPDILLLDEPTNHLDIDSVTWLEGYLKDISSTVIIVSHDRYFLDRVVTKIIEIENKRSNVYYGNYTYYAQKKEVDRQNQLKRFLDQQKIIKHHEEFIKIQKARATEKSLKLAHSREKLLEKIEVEQKPENLPDKMRIILKTRVKSGNDVLMVRDLSKQFGDKKIFENISFDINRGEKVAVIGPNGVGKTTLMKIILSEIEASSGKLRLGTNVKIGYYDQEQVHLDESKTIFQEISDAYPTMTNLEIRNALAAFIFTGDDVFQNISTLSGGEKGRVLLAKLMLSNSNFLLLDEPTNHLDMFSKQILEDAIVNYTGTVLYISHDRYFIDRTATRTLQLTHTKMNNYLGNYTYYIEKRVVEAAAITKTEEAVSENQEERIRKKSNLAEERRRKAALANIEKQIQAIELQLKELDEMLLKEEVYTDYTKAQQVLDEKEKYSAELEHLYEEWESKAE